ncbi:MAG: HAD family hydrolase, partial [Acidimicrobiia bacterium]
HYFDLATTVELAHDAREAIAIVADNSWSQSLLSMSPDDWLHGIVERLDLAAKFERIDGLSEDGGGGLKANHLERHLGLMGISGRDTVVIGDTRDDVAAARHVGATPILFHGGSHHMEVLEAEGVPIADTLVQAVQIALSRR